VLETIGKILWAGWGTLTEMSSYLLFGFAMAGLLSVLISPAMVERHLGGRGLVSVIKASLFGVPLPLCSCGVIPVAASLRRHGASAGATTAFLLSTPQTGVDSIFVTLSLLGPLFAIYRPVAALTTGILGGWLASLVVAGTSAATPPAKCHDACCDITARGGALSRAARYGFLTLPQDIAKSLLVGVLIAGVISALIPTEAVPTYLKGGIGAMLVMMALGIPLYVCATASVPIAFALITKGISPGAALVFLMTGPATNAATIAIIWKIMGRRVAAVYLITVAVTALGCGLLLDHLFVVTASTAAPVSTWMLPNWVKIAGAVALLAILGRAIFRSAAAARPDAAPAPGEDALKLKVSGMTCSHCTASVERALAGVTGVESVVVNLKGGTAAVTGQGMEIEALLSAVANAGYQASAAQSPDAVKGS